MTHRKGKVAAVEALERAERVLLQDDDEKPIVVVEKLGIAVSCLETIAGVCLAPEACGGEEYQRCFPCLARETLGVLEAR